MALPFSITLSSEFLYGFLMKQLSVLMTTHAERTCTAYLSSASPSKPVAPVEDDERELDLLQMDRLLKWMALVFDGFTPGSPLESEEAHRAYKQELFSIYRTLCSDYQQYRRWKQYNQSIWFLSYRRQDTKALARKMLSDVRLFKEGLQLWAVMGSPKVEV
jgi:hypothetical protein